MLYIIYNYYKVKRFTDVNNNINTRIFFANIFNKMNKLSLTKWKKDYMYIRVQLLVAIMLMRYRLDSDNCNVNCNYYINYSIILSELFACNRKNMILE